MRLINEASNMNETEAREIINTYRKIIISLESQLNKSQVLVKLLKKALDEALK